jgi:GNAT superfamily N-acetyltransferase
MADPVIRTHLELTAPGDLRPAAEPRLDAPYAIERVDPPDGATSAWFYAHVGGPYSWTDHAGRTAGEWQAWADRVETWVLTVAGERAGYYELADHGDAVEIAYFGLLQGFHGRGLGGHLLTHAIRTAQARHDHVIVHTCTLDGPHALANYEARGMRAVRTEAIGPP